ncbi:Arsenical resistance protein arsH [Pseudomonas syringae pv. ribicola]|uniref:Arsenical resistance protein arsH n=1 Tax=Pseudomonas syringae pv. ribicola TaxID=55398 RepID=A0A3M2VP60_PSESI|nr:Arsenical resistance protein arsH [Pseudomonas syringae pv. ribicola]
MGIAGHRLVDILAKSTPLKLPGMLISKAFLEFDDAGRMKPFAYYDRVVDVMEELMKFTLMVRGRETYLVDRYSERKESAEALSKRVNQRSI